MSIHLIPFIIGALIGGFAGVFFARLTSQRPVESSDETVRAERKAARLESHVAVLETRHRQHIEFFVNFPEVVKSMTAAMTVGQATAACSRGLSALIQMRVVAIFLANSKSELRLVDGMGFPVGARDKVRLDVQDTSCREVLARRGVVTCSQRLRELLATHGVRVDQAAPLWHGEQLFGVIFVGECSGDATTNERTLAMVADLTGVGLAAASRINKMRHEAERDGLTGLPNRRTLDRRLKNELDRCLAYRTYVSLAMIDVDHFKAYNDRNGHQAGDEVLKGVANAIASVTRRTDFVARYGGEEFTVLLLGADPDQAMMHADRLRRTVASTVFAHGASQPMGCISVSIGVATAPRDAKHREALFEAADQALYEAKEQGRNRVVAYSGPSLTDDTGIDAGSSVTEEELMRALARGD